MGRLKLGYTKSRTGCVRCKARRVKCDENRPCRACVRHGIECSLVSSSASARSSEGEGSQTPPLQIQSQSQSSGLTLAPLRNPVPNNTRQLRPLAVLEPQPGSSSHQSPASSLHYESPPDCFSKFITHHVHDDTANWVSDLELLHHFSTSTYKTLFGSSLPPRPDRDNVWMIEVPKMSFNHIYLLHQLLAISAFHLAYLQPHMSKKYSVQATQHQSIAVNGVRQVLPDITSENCHPLFAASSLFFLGALAAGRPVPTAGISCGPHLEDLIDVFLLVKGVGNVLLYSEAELRGGPFSPLFVNVPAGESTLVLDRVISQINNYLLRVLKIPKPDPAREVLEAEVSAFDTCVKRAIAYASTPEYRIIASWPISMTDKFIALLRQRHHAALALLSYYCVIMHATETGYWFTDGWSCRIMQDISQGIVAPWDQDTTWALGWIMGSPSQPST